MLALAEQHVAGAVDLSRKIVRAAMIGMQFDHQPAMRLLDLFDAGAGRKAEDRIGFLDADIAGGGTGGAGARLRTSQPLAPIGVEAVEIGLEQAGALLVLGPAFAQQREQLGDPQLVKAHAGEAAGEDRAAHRAGIVVERHAHKRGRHARTLAAIAEAGAAAASTAATMPKTFSARARRSGSALTNR